MDMLDIYTDYLICQNKYATATGLSDMVDGEFSRDKVTRFLRQENFDSKRLWKYVKSAVRERENQNGVLILDDSIEDKPYTNENEVNCWHYSHAKGDVVKGIKVPLQSNFNRLSFTHPIYRPSSPGGSYFKMDASGF